MENRGFLIKKLDGKRYLQYTFIGGEEDAVGLRVLSRAPMAGLLQGLVWQDGEQTRLRFDIDGLVSFSDMPEDIRPDVFFAAVRGVAAAVESASDHVFSEDWILFERRFLFYSPADGSVKLVSLPLKEPPEPFGWRSFVLELCGGFSLSDCPYVREAAEKIAGAAESGAPAAEILKLAERGPEPGPEPAPARRPEGLVSSVRKLFMRKSPEDPSADKIRRPVLKLEGGGLHRIDSLPFVIGRGAGCDLVISDERYVSRIHAKILFENGEYLFKDEGSRNGSRINGRTVGKNGEVLRRGDVIRLPGVSMIFLPDRGGPSGENR